MTNFCINSFFNILTTINNGFSGTNDMLIYKRFPRNRKIEMIIQKQSIDTESNAIKHVILT